MPEGEPKKIQWHPGFIAAMELELAENRADLLFEKEHNLNTGPLAVDLLVIKKAPDVPVSNEIGEIFRTHNLWEYKSETDSLDIDVFYKNIGYACLYKSYGDTVNERPSGEVTVSFIRRAKPEGLFRALEAQGIRIQNPHRGIYRISGILSFRVQVVVIRELEGRSHVWLKSLSSHLEKEDIERLLGHIRLQTGKHEREMADSVLDVCLRANRELVRGLKGDEEMSEALLELMEPVLKEDRKMSEALLAMMEPMLEERDRKNITQGISQGMAQGISQGISQGMVIAYYDMNLSTGEIARKLHLGQEEVEQIIRDLKDKQ